MFQRNDVLTLIDHETGQAEPARLLRRIDATDSGDELWLVEIAGQVAERLVPSVDAAGGLFFDDFIGYLGF